MSRRRQWRTGTASRLAEVRERYMRYSIPEKPADVIGAACAHLQQVHAGGNEHPCVSDCVGARAAQQVTRSVCPNPFE